jgi:hypothetical protein
MKLIARTARNTARCSTRSYWLRSMSRLTCDRQSALQLDPISSAPSNVRAIVRVRPQPLPPRVTADARNAYREFVETLGKDAIWLDYFTVRSVAA